MKGRNEIELFLFRFFTITGGLECNSNKNSIKSCHSGTRNDVTVTFWRERERERERKRERERNKEWVTK